MKTYAPCCDKYKGDAGLTSEADAAACWRVLGNVTWILQSGIADICSPLY